MPCLGSPTAFHYARYEPAVWAEAHMQTMRDRGLITFDTVERSALFSDEFSASIGDGLMDSYAAVMAESASTDLSDQRIVYDFRQRVPRMTLNGVEALRGRMIVRLPLQRMIGRVLLTIPPGFATTAASSRTRSSAPSRPMRRFPSPKLECR